MYGVKPLMYGVDVRIQHMTQKMHVLFPHIGHGGGQFWSKDRDVLATKGSKDKDVFMVMTRKDPCVFPVFVMLKAKKKRVSHNSKMKNPYREYIVGWFLSSIELYRFRRSVEKCRWNECPKYCP